MAKFVHFLGHYLSNGRALLIVPVVRNSPSAVWVMDGDSILSTSLCLSGEGRSHHRTHFSPWVAMVTPDPLTSGFVRRQTLISHFTTDNQQRPRKCQCWPTIFKENKNKNTRTARVGAGMQNELIIVNRLSETDINKQWNGLRPELTPVVFPLPDRMWQNGQQ